MRYELDRADQILSVDDTWNRFALENDSPNLVRDSVVGTSIWDHVHGSETKQLYKQLFQQVRKLGSPASLPFRCDSPTVRRFLRLQIAPSSESGLLLTSSTENLETRTHIRLFDPGAERTDDLLVVCGWCKDVRLPDLSWVDVETAINSLRLFDSALPRLSHGMCPDCHTQYFKRYGQ